MEKRFDLLDVDRSGTIDMEEFCELLHVVLLEIKNQKFRPPPLNFPLRERIVNLFFSMNIRKKASGGVAQDTVFKERRSFRFLIKMVVICQLAFNAVSGVTFIDAFRNQQGVYARFELLSNANTQGAYNTFFVAFYLFEIVCKAIALHPLGYWKRDFFDKMDICLSLLGIPAIMLLAGDPGTARVLFAVQCLRIFSVIVSTRNVLRVIVSVLPAFYHIAMLCLGVMYSLSIAGMWIFDGFKAPTDDLVKNNPMAWTDILDARAAGFSTFSESMLTMFQFFIAQNFTELMNVYVQDAGFLSLIYFVAAVIIGNVLMANLFIGMVVDAFLFMTKNTEKEQEERVLYHKNVHVLEDTIVDGEEESHCWVCLKPLLEEERPFQPFDECTCRFHRSCIINYDFRRGECPRCRMIKVYHDEEPTGQSSLEYEMYGRLVLTPAASLPLSLPRCWFDDASPPFTGE